MRIAVGTLGILFGFGTIAWSAFPIFVTLLSWGFAPLGGGKFLVAMGAGIRHDANH